MTKRNNFNRQKALARDNHQCQRCFTPENLDIHHLDGDCSNNDPDNALVLCRKCHVIVERNALEARRYYWLEDIYQKDLQTEQEIIQNWLSNGRSLDEIGGDDFQDFKFDYLVNDGGEKAKDNESTHQ